MYLFCDAVKILILFLVLYVCNGLMCRKHKPNHDKQLWRDEPKNVFVSWTFDDVCSSTKECHGFEGPQLIPQLCPVQMQENDNLFLRSPQNLFVMNPVNISHDDFKSCSVLTYPQSRELFTEPTNQIHLVPEDFLTLGDHFFAQVPNGSFSKCEFGLRLNVVVKGSNCRNLTDLDTSLCSNKGVCNTHWFDPEFRCNCEPFFTGAFCGEFDACAEKPCLNDALCTDVPAGLINEDYFCDCPANFSGNSFILF